MADRDVSVVRFLSKRHEGSIRNMVLCTFYACVGALNFGFTIGYSSPAISSMIKLRVLRYEDTNWFGSLMTIGALLGGLISGCFMEKIGRKRTVFVSALPFLLGYGFLSFREALFDLFAGRFLTGIGSGMITVCVPVYIAEIATNSRRGVLGSCVQLFVVIGICLVYVLGLCFEWRPIAFAGFLIAVVSAVAAHMIPETPRWLLVRNQKVEARRALAAVRDPHADVQDELADIEKGLDAQQEMSWSEFFGRQELKQPLFICIVVMICQQFSGINVVMFYSVFIFTAAIPDFALIATVLIGIVQVIATIFACFLMDHAGRRKLLIVAGCIMAVALFFFGLFNKMASLKLKLLPENFFTLFPVLCLTCYIIGFSLGWGPVPMLLMSEIFPAKGRGTAGAIAAFFSWLASFVVTKYFLALQDVLGKDGVFYFFSFCCVFSVWFVWKFLPETKGKSLEDIERYFLGRSVIKV